MNSAPFLQGLGLGLSLIVAIGAQNAYVLRQGLKRENHLLIATICSLSDAFLILLGGAGVGTLIASTPLLATGAAVFGATFLGVYGALALRRAWRGDLMASNGDTARATTLKQAVLTALAFSLLNPHAWLDTVVLLGSISGQYGWDQRGWFLTGAVCASLLWFFALSLAAGFLAPLFQKPRTWRILDTAIGLVMWAIAYNLAAPLFGSA